MNRSSENINIEFTVKSFALERGTRIATQADVVRMNMWIAWNAFEEVFRARKRSSAIEKSRAEKAEAQK
jgi:hypothetical protein